MPTIDTDEMYGRDLVLVLHPISGPHDHWSTVTAADEMDEYMRTLVHITLHERYQSSLPYPSTVDAALSSLASLVSMSGQFMEQLGDRLGNFRDDPKVSDDRGEDVTVRIDVARGELAMAIAAAANLQQALTSVRRQTSHLSYS